MTKLKHFLKKNGSYLGLSFAYLVVLLGGLQLSGPPFGSDITKIFNNVFGILLIICWVLPIFIILAPFVAIYLAFLFGKLVSSLFSRKREIIIALAISVVGTIYLVTDYSGVWYQQEQDKFWRDLAHHGKTSDVNVVRCALDRADQNEKGKYRTVILAYDNPVTRETASLSEYWPENAPHYGPGDTITIYYLVDRSFKYKWQHNRFSTEHNIYFQDALINTKRSKA